MEKICATLISMIKVNIAFAPLGQAQEMEESMSKRKSEIVWEETFSGGNAVWEVMLFLIFIAGIVTNHLTQFPVLYSGLCGGIGLAWVISYILFRKHSQIGFVKCCSLQLILCGLAGAVLISVVNQFFSITVIAKDIITVMLVMVMAIINYLRHDGKHTVYYLTFLLFPYCLLTANLFLVTGFLSAILLLIGLFNGTLIFENQRLEDDEYFGNTNHSNEKDI